MTEYNHFVVEMIGQSHETEREDLTNEEVVTLPVVDGPYDDIDQARDSIKDGYPYEVVSIPE